MVVVGLSGVNVMEGKLRKLLIAIIDSEYFVVLAKEQAEAVDPDDRDSGDPAVNLADARSELSNASNAIDDAMGLIDEMLAPEPTREDL